MKADNKNLIIKASELSKYVDSDKWAEELFNYCHNHYNEFLCRYGFIDLLDIEIILEKMEAASPKEIRLIKDIFKSVYKAYNIKDFFINDREKIKMFREKVGQMSVTGVNKPLAKKELEEYLDDIIMRLGEADKV